MIKILRDRLHKNAAYKSVFNSPDGELVIQDLMKQCGLLNPQITTDTNLLLIQQGQQRIVLSILRILGKDAAEITEQIKESMKHETTLDT